MEKNIYENLYTIFNQNVENIKVFLASNSYSEVEYVAKQIIKLVQKENYRYKDIIVISKNLEEYSYLCKAIFNQYKIPVFIDEKKQLSLNIFIKYIVAVLDIFAQNWSYDSVFNYIKTGFLDLDEDEIHILENYCLKWGIKQSKWYNGDWNFEDEEEKEQIQRLRNIVIRSIIKTKRKFIRYKNSRRYIKNFICIFIRKQHR